MKAGKFVMLPLLALGMAFTSAAFAAENSKPTPTPQVKEAPFLLQIPLANDTYRLTSNFGVRMNPETKEKTIHNGIDYAAPKGTPIYAAADGVVIVANRAKGYGETIMIKHH
ncbi:MAG: M23 family metallopeptidase, partial [Clostridia bacterium]